jgi:hypothetical protein
VEKIQKLIKAGVPIPDAIVLALGMSIKEFSLLHARMPSNIGQILRGRLAPSDKDLEALMTQLGGSEEEWRRLLWLAGEPVAAQAVG